MRVLHFQLTALKRRANRRKLASVEIRQFTVVKLQAPKQSKIERLRTVEALHLSRRTGVFRVAEIQDFDDEAGVIVFERLTAMKSLRQLFTVPQNLGLAARAGHVLATIHTAGLDGSSKVKWHGDFGLRNLFYSEARDEFLVLDWNNAHWVGVPGEQTPPPLTQDLAMFLISLFIRRPGGPLPVRNIPRIAAMFLEAYAKERGGQDVVALRSEFVPILRDRVRHLFRRKGILFAIIYLASIFHAWWFVRRYRLPGSLGGN